MNEKFVLKRSALIFLIGFVIFLIVGFILGGKVGIGTIIAMLAIGPFIQFCLPYGKKFVGIVLNGKEKSNNESTVIA